MNFLSFIFIIQAWATMFEVLPDAFDSGNKINISVLSEREASNLFKEFKSDDSIPHKYYPTGCNDRATAMARIAEKKQIEMGKVYIHGMLRAKLLGLPGHIAMWGWHVAPVVYVMKNNKPQLMVFDPSLFNGPVTQEKWEAAMQVKGDPRPHSAGTYYSSRYQYLHRAEEVKKYNWHSKDLEHVESRLKLFKRYLDKNDFDLPPDSQFLKTESRKVAQ